MNTIREQLRHPVIDADGHSIEFMPLVRDICKEIAGAEIALALEKSGCFEGMPSALEAKKQGGNPGIRPPWWALPARNTLDRATAMFPELLYGRLDEIGLDYAVLYPTHGLFALTIKPDELRRAACRAFNVYHSRFFDPYSDRLATVALIPMGSPEEAVEELHFAKAQGLKCILLGGMMGKSRQGRYQIEIAGFENELDYDPVWRTCVELGFSPTFHSSGMGWGSRTSPNNYVFNHIGNFAAAQEAICRGMFLGGVTYRFPELRFAFLEGGVGWACNLFADLVSHWQKRNIEHLAHYNPNNLDRQKFNQLFDQYAPNQFKERSGELENSLRILSNPAEDPASLDEFEAVGLTQESDIYDRFITPFYFGCEADDSMNPLAFNKKINPMDAELKVLFSSDIGHWDVPDMNGVLHEAFELVDDGLMSETNFEAFVYGNAASLLTANNPSFFADTVLQNKI
jgi:predicted TIM-barrel fold metal-dependent hydrolase